MRSIHAAGRRGRATYAYARSTGNGRTGSPQRPHHSMAFTRATHGRGRVDPRILPPRIGGRAVHARTPGAVRARAAERAPCRGGACASGSAESVPLLGRRPIDRPGCAYGTPPMPCARDGMDDQIARAADGVGRRGSGSGACMHACARIGELLALFGLGRIVALVNSNKLWLLIMVSNKVSL